MAIKTVSAKHLMKKIYRSAGHKRHAQNIMFELTYRCNFRCPHCYVKGSPAGGKELSTRQVFSIIDQLKNMGVYSIAFTGGEPLLRKDIFKILTYSKKNGFYTTLLSNGYFIDKKTAAKLREINVNKVEITLNSISPGVFNELTGIKDGLQRVKSAIRLLVRNGIIVTIKSTAMIANRNELVKIGLFARSLDIIYNMDAEIAPCRNRDKSYIKQYSLAQEDFGAVRRLVYPEMFSGKRNKPRSSRKRDKMFNCSVGNTSFSITPYGKMNFCLEIEYPQLDIISKGAENCWEEIKKKTDRLNKKKNFICKNCELIHYCGWCPGRSFTETGSFNKCSEYFKECAINAKKGGRNGPEKGFQKKQGNNRA